MIQASYPVTSLREVAWNTFVVSFRSPVLASTILPGQFLNIRVSEAIQPLLRRPFSVYRVDGDEISVIFNAVGIGTTLMAHKREGDLLNVLGPLGRPYRIDDQFSSAILVGGGLGIAPLPILTTAIRRLRGRNIVTLIGSRSADHIVVDYLENVEVATDDGSMGFHGTVVDLLRDRIRRLNLTTPKIFACGPTPMLRNVASVAAEFGIPCEMSVETVMACGIGICQGCPVELVNGEKRYSLSCTEGPVYDSRTIRL